VKRNHKFAGLTFLCAILVGGPGFAEEGHHGRDNRAPQVLPLRILRNFVVLAEGQFGAAGEPQSFLLDTGTAPSIVDPRIIRKLGLATTVSEMTVIGKVIPTQTAILPEVDLGPIRALSLPVQVQDLSQFKHDFGIAIVGILGLDVLAQSNFRLDYEKKQLVFGEASSEGIPIPFDARHGLPIATVRLEGQPARMLIDTGSDRVAVFGGNFKDTGGLALRRTSQKGSSVVDEAVGVEVFFAPDIVLDQQHFTVERAYFLPGSASASFDGLLGVRALGFRALTYDRTRGAIYLER
jgi:hypothetical protein